MVVRKKWDPAWSWSFVGPSGLVPRNMMDGEVEVVTCNFHRYWVKIFMGHYIILSAGGQMWTDRSSGCKSKVMNPELRVPTNNNYNVTLLWLEARVCKQDFMKREIWLNNSCCSRRWWLSIVSKCKGRLEESIVVRACMLCCLWQACSK